MYKAFEVFYGVCLFVFGGGGRSGGCVEAHADGASPGFLCSLHFALLSLEAPLFTFLSLHQVVSEDEYQRRVDALNSEDLRALCRRLQVPHPSPSSHKPPKLAPPSLSTMSQHADWSLGETQWNYSFLRKFHSMNSCDWHRRPPNPEHPLFLWNFLQACCCCSSPVLSIHCSPSGGDSMGWGVVGWHCFAV